MGAAGVELITTEPASLNVAALQEQLNRNGLQTAAIASGGMAFAAKLTLLNPDPPTAALARTAPGRIDRPGCSPARPGCHRGQLPRPGCFRTRRFAGRAGPNPAPGR